jgi:peptidoglycan/xylan/chitin deacetylase (PgdA/CDA1 family)
MSMSAEAPAHLILMYHGLSQGQAAVRGADPHYTLPRARFEEQLDGLRAAGFELGCARDLLPDCDAAPRTRVMLTFDDGDASNFEVALPALTARGLSADFFVNPARVGSEGFCSWDQLRQMARAGMSIQSHGHTHTYFTALDAASLREELRVSKAEIEQQLGQPVSLLAPPGGRVPHGLVELAAELGYVAVLGSAPGALVVDTDRHLPLPRLALTHEHRVEHLLDWCRGGASALAPLQRRYRRLALAKRVLGDRGYEQVRGLALGLLRGLGR